MILIAILILFALIAVSAAIAWLLVHFGHEGVAWGRVLLVVKVLFIVGVVWGCAWRMDENRRKYEAEIRAIERAAEAQLIDMEIRIMRIGAALDRCFGVAP